MEVPPQVDTKVPSLVNMVVSTPTDTKMFVLTNGRFFEDVCYYLLLVN